MRRRRISLIGVAFVTLLLLVIVFLARVSLHRPPEVSLPQLDETESGGDMVSDAGQEAIRRVEVTPETVQRVVERLARPDNYDRTITIERFWSGGSGQTTAQVRAADDWARIDVAENGETQRHIITGGGESWIWYGEEGPVFSGAAALTSDEELSIPTYEDILLLKSAAIAVADYRALDTANCIYVEAEPDSFGYVDRWWISVDNGLLIAAERAQGDTVVYRMLGLAVETGVVDEQAFRLPTEEILYEPQAEEDEAAEG